MFVSIFLLLAYILSPSVSFAALKGETKPFRAFSKSLFVKEDTYAKGYAPNVLLFLDVGSPMLWTPFGKLPICKDGHYDSSLLDQCTFGSGARPWIHNSREIWQRYGRDLDNTNNVIESADCYYRPDATKPYKLIFRNSNFHVTPPSSYTVNDLVPNDSRMYKTKLVLWRVLNNSELLKNMRLALATSAQEQTRTNDGLPADFYKKSPYSGGPDWAVCRNNYNDSQNIRWGILRNYYEDPVGSVNWGRVNRGFLRISFDTYSTAHISKFLSLIDGEEITTENIGHFNVSNEELVADGQTPLAMSVYGVGSDFVRTCPSNCGTEFGGSTVDSLSSGQAYGSAKDFFNFKAIQGTCQKNWLVVFTAGDDSSGAKAEDAVKNLYANTKTMKDINGNTITMDTPVQTMIVGFVDPNSQDPDVVTLRNTLTKMAQNGQPLADGSPNPNVSPYFANDVPGLVGALQSVFTTIGASNYAGGAPVVLPPKVNSSEGILFNSTFTIDENGLWTGTFSKSTLNLETNAYSESWEAGEKLPPAASRTLLSVEWDQTGTGAAELFAGTNCCTVLPNGTSQKPSLSNEIFWSCDDATANMFINWLRGSYWNGSAYVARTNPLLDMEHSGLTVVTGPSASYSDSDYTAFKTTNASRDVVVYIQSNGGILHAFDYDTGVEKWGFIPPNVLHFNRLARLRFPFDDGVNPANPTATPAMSDKTFPVYVLDGSVVAEDVKLSTGYATVVLGLLGNGGSGMYAMNITNPSKPQFLWAIENQMSYNQGIVYRWAPATTGSVTTNATLYPHATISGAYNYRRLGMTKGVPAIGYVENNANKSWVFIDGAGMNQNLASADVSETGRALYVSSIEDGQILREFVSKDVSGSLSGETIKLGMILTAMSPFVATSGGPITEVYTADHRGHVLKVNLDGGSATSWTVNTLFTLKYDSSRTTNTRPVRIPHALEVGFFGGKKWVFGGTANLKGPDLQVLSNDAQYIFGFNSEVSPDLSLIKEDLYSVTPANDSAYLGDPTSIAAGLTAGWNMPLQSRNVLKKQDAEYASTPPILYSGSLLISTFIPSIEDASDQCQIGGTARLYIMDADTSKGQWGKATNARFVEFSGIKISGLTVAKGKVFLGIKELNPGFDPASVEGGILKNSVKRGGLLVFDLPEGIGSVEGVLPNKQKVQYWREIFR